MKSPLVSLLAAALLVGCGHLNPVYQNTAEQPTRSIVPKNGYELAFIEFGEQGSYQDPTQLQNAVDLIKRTPRPLVITYVHGWHNSAQSADVDKFSEWLAQISQSPLIRNTGFHPIGIYLGWRGESTTVPVVRQFTFFSRKAAAERLASNFDCYDAIAALSQAARESYGAGGQYTVLIGHSFGGLVVERAVAHAINAEMHGHAAADRSLPADLILMVNPASDSILTRQMIAALYSRHTENSRPFLVSLTSTGDAATGVAFPVSTSLAATTKVFNEVTPPGTEKRESERRFYTETPGHNQFLINHETVKLDKTMAAPGGLNALQTNLSHNLSGEVFTTDAAPGRLDLWHIKRVGNVDVPYWDVKVDPTIIMNHGDIWNPKAQAMMAAIFRMTNPLMNRESKMKPRANLQKAPIRPTLVPESNSSRPQPQRKVKNESSAKPTPNPSPTRKSEAPFERTR
jgi:pimeloyl-ACP methyl ester carboxylesterase